MPWTVLLHLADANAACLTIAPGCLSTASRATFPGSPCWFLWALFLCFSFSFLKCDLNPHGEHVGELFHKTCVHSLSVKTGLITPWELFLRGCTHWGSDRAASCACQADRGGSGDSQGWEPECSRLDPWPKGKTSLHSISLEEAQLS